MLISALYRYTPLLPVNHTLVGHREACHEILSQHQDAFVLSDSKILMFRDVLGGLEAALAETGRKTETPIDEESRHADCESIENEDGRSATQADQSIQSIGQCQASRPHPSSLACDSESMKCVIIERTSMTKTPITIIRSMKQLTGRYMSVTLASAISVFPSSIPSSTKSLHSVQN